MEDYKKRIEEYLDIGVDARKAIDPKDIEFISKKIYEAMKNGNKLILFGNGGSAADAQHIAGEFIGRFLIERRSLPAVSLTVNTSNLTAIGNDYGYDEIFSRQLEGIGKKGDVVIGLSTSGNSPNVIKGIKKAKSMGMYTIGLTGGKGGSLKNEADKTIVAKAEIHGQIQEVHITIGHLISLVVEDMMFSS
jgi:D-sedoheptulose 7-phosphate isomerase